MNGVNIEGMRHAEVVAFIKNGGEGTRLLVVDPDTDEHFKTKGFVPTVDHLRGQYETTDHAAVRSLLNVQPCFCILHSAFGVQKYFIIDCTLTIR